MICIRFEAMPRTLHRRAPELQCSRHREIGWIVKGSRVELPCSIKHLRCYLCCACRLATSQAFAPAYRRSTSSVSSATFAVLGCRVASSPSDEEDCCLWISALRLPSSALPYVTVVAAYSMAGRGLFRETHGGQRHGLRHRSCAAWLNCDRRKNAALRV